MTYLNPLENYTMKRHFLTTLLISFGLVFALSNAWAEPTPFAKEHGKPFYQHSPEYSRLTADKKAFVDKTMHESFERMHAEESMLFAKMAMLNAKLMQATVDRKEIDTLMGEINHMHADLLQTRVDTTIKIKDATGITLPLMPPRARMMFMEHNGPENQHLEHVEQ